MKVTVWIAAVAIATTTAPLSLGTRLAFAQVGFWQPGAEANDFGKPDFPNYLAPDGRGTCDWWTSAYEHACPTAISPPEVVAPPRGVPLKAPSH